MNIITFIYYFYIKIFLIKMLLKKIKNTFPNSSVINFSFRFSYINSVSNSTSSSMFYFGSPYFNYYSYIILIYN